MALEQREGRASLAALEERATEGAPVKENTAPMVNGMPAPAENKAATEAAEMVVEAALTAVEAGVLGSPPTKVAPAAPAPVVAAAPGLPQWLSDAMRCFCLKVSA